MVEKMSVKSGSHGGSPKQSFKQYLTGVGRDTRSPPTSPTRRKFTPQTVRSSSTITINGKSFAFGNASSRQGQGQGQSQESTTTTSQSLRTSTLMFAQYRSRAASISLAELALSTSKEREREKIPAARSRSAETLRRVSFGDRKTVLVFDGTEAPVRCRSGSSVVRCSI